MFQKFVSGLCVFALLFMAYVEGGDVGSSVCCMWLKLMPYMEITKEKKHVCHPSVRFVHNGRLALYTETRRRQRG